MEADQIEQEPPVGNEYQNINISGGKVILGNVSSPNNFDDAEKTKEEAENAVFDALRYENMSTREDQLDRYMVGPQSFEWVWQTPLTEWLQSGDTLFWIAGKPASGKSTLTRFLTKGSKTLQCLRSSGQEWEIVHFFFDFRAGETMANQVEGMVRSFLSQLAASLLDAMERLLKYQQRQPLNQLSLDKLISLVCDIVKRTKYQICAFVDGLDEYEGDGVQLLDVLEDIRHRSGMKICLASRQIHPFDEVLYLCPQVRMQEHNCLSMRAYISRKIIQYRRECINIERKLTAQLQDELIEKSQGVFLWTKLAVDELIEMIQQNTTSSELRKVLEGLPSELEGLYQRILNKLSSERSEEAAMHLHFLVSHEGAISPDFLLLSIQLLSYQLPELTDYMQMSLGDFTNHVKLLLNPLLDVQEYRIALMHKTLSRFLTHSGWIKNNLTVCLQEQHPNITCLRMHQNFLIRLTSTLACEQLHSKIVDPPPKFPWGNFQLIAQQSLSIANFPNDDLVASALLGSLCTVPEKLRTLDCSNPVTYGLAKSLLQAVPIFWLLAIDHIRLLSFIKQDVISYETMKMLLRQENNMPVLFAIIHNLVGFLHRYIKTERQIPKNEKRILLNFAILWKDSVPGTSDTVSDLFLETLSENGRQLETAHVCLAMCKPVGNVNCFRRNILPHQCMENREIVAQQAIHCQLCPSFKTRNRLLFDWATALLHPYSGSLPHVILDWLKLLISRGEDLNSKCFANGGVMQALFIYHPSVFSKFEALTLLKLLVLIELGLTVRGKSEMKTILRTVKNLLGSSRRLKLWKRVKDQEPRAEWYYNLNCTDLDQCIEILQFAVRNQTWPDMSKYQQICNKDFARHGENDLFPILKTSQIASP